LTIFFAKNLNAQNFNFQNFNVEDGLSQSEVTCIYEDTRGFIWLGTAGGGINMFDGLNFQSFEEREGLSGSIITCISEDNEGNLWIGTTWGGVNKFDGKRITFFNKESGLLDNYVTSIVADNNGKVWVGSESGITVFDGVEFTYITEKNGLKTGNVNYLFKDLSGKIWIAGRNGLQYYEGKQLYDIVLNNEQANNILFLKQDIEGNIWYYTASNKVYYITKQGAVVPFSYNYLFNNSEITSLHCDNDGIVWITTSNFWLLKFYKEKIDIFTTDNGLPKIPIRSIYKDRSGNLWLGTQGYGLVKFTNTPFTYFEKFEGLNSPAIFNIVQDSQGNLWLGSINEGLIKFDGQKVTRWNSLSQLPSLTIYGLSIDKNDVLWIATKEGLCKYDGKKFTTFTQKDGLPTNRIRSVLCDSKGDVWIGTSGNGLYKFDGKLFQKISDKDNSEKQSVHCIFEDKNQNIWFGTGAGAFKLSNNNITHYGVEQGLCNSYIGSIIQDKQGKMWFATDRCIASFDGIKIKTYNQMQGLTSNTIYLIQFDDEGNLWVGTNKGLDKISFTSYGQIQAIKHYSKSEGFTGIECNARSVLKDREGNLYFGTVKGLTKYNPKLDFPDVVEPDLHITNINLDYEQVDWKQYSNKVTPWFQLPENLSLPYDKNHLTFEFKAITKTSPEKTFYSYILEGFDEQWSPYSKQTFVTYSKLPPGKYTFKVKACNNSNNCTKYPRSFTFTVKPAFWQTSWFYIVLILSISFYITRYIRYRVRKQKEIEEALEKTVEERTQEIKKQKEQIEILLKEIHHRVKNNLQIINSLMNLQSGYADDEYVQEMFKEARNRIITMALIHEKLYESKDLTNINLREYLDKLIDYLKSSYVLNSDVKFKTEIEDIKLNIDTVIPLGILINEIISNSLKYAFIRSTGLPEIFISIKKQDDGYTLIAGDNGSGFDKKLFDSETNTLGLELIKMLSEQLNGTVEILDKTGTWYHIKFKGIL
jgi:two-component sensor histidine kinase/ligand-binding sensor domain-containing protein